MDSLSYALIALGVGLLVGVLVAALAWGLGNRRFRAQVSRLRDDIHELLASPDADKRIVVNGRPSAFVDIAASINRLLERTAEAGTEVAGRGEFFEVLADTMPEVALIHSSTIQYANRAAGELFSVTPQTLVGKPVTDLMRPAYRAMMRKLIATHLTDETPLEPVEVQLIDGGERGLWVELHSRRVSFDGQPAFISVARDITHRKSLEASLGRGKLQARITLESIGEGVITTNSDGVIDYMNEAGEQLIGTTRGLAIGRRVPDLMALVDEIDGESLGDPVDLCLSERRRVDRKSVV